ncbi:hypothetical protein A6E15_09365 [Natrinema saccharevitans]|uniref:Uncharacterized protein n=1 Tax=Natrinema saccharevitans TaxID=301967 RepID=A0A1S8AWF0_9EURY|nr:hypothetical protein [Natrinema saccharevitans]OLZ41183.1 hypothetical protein A6E15_09365 [Natrinema saccharevitans]
MERTHRRKLLATTGAGLAAFGAGCLGRFGGEDDESDDAESPTEDGDSTVTPLERWVPTSGSEELLFHYRDLTALETYEDALQASVIEAVPTLPDGDSAAVVEAAADGTDAIDSVLRFGSEGVVGNVVVDGSFDPDALETDGSSSVGEFETFGRDDVSVAVSEETIVVSPADGAALEAILAAGIEGADRRIDSHGNFAQLVDRVGDSTFLWGEYEGRDDGVGAVFSWELGAERAAYSGIAVYADADGTDEFEDAMADRSADLTVETDGNVGVATRVVPVEEYEYRDLFAERGSQPTEPYAGVSLDTDRKPNAVVVMYHSSGTADRVEVRDESGVRVELTEVGQAETIEYESGTSATITVVAVSGDEESVLMTETVSF